MFERQRRTPDRRARIACWRISFATVSRLNRTCSTPSRTRIDSLDVLIVSALRPQASVFVLSDVRSELCSSAPLGIASAATGSKRGMRGVFMHRIVGGQPGAINVQKLEKRI